LIVNAAGGSNAAALQQMDCADMIHPMDAVGWVMLIDILTMSAMSIYWIIFNAIKHARLRGSSDRVISTFWETQNAQDAIRAMEEERRSEPFSKRSEEHTSELQSRENL